METTAISNAEPGRLQEYWTKMATFYNTMVASKELFGSIHCPVLVMAGERDTNAPLATVIAAYQMIPNSQLAIIPHAPHPVFLANFPQYGHVLFLFCSNEVCT